MGSDDFVEPGGAGGLIFRGEDFDNVAVLQLFVEVAHLAVDFDADDVRADF